MNATDKKRWMMWSAGLSVALVSLAIAQTVDEPGPQWAQNVIVPQSRAFALGPGGGVGITGVTAGVVILEQVATTTMDITLRNPHGHLAEAELLVPVPAGAVVRGFAFEGSAAEPTARLLPADEARRTYDAIVAKIRDPALLEFAGYSSIRSSVFPVPPNGTQKVRLTYEHILPRDGARVDYVLPRTEVLDYAVPWQVSVRIKSQTPISTVYSPSHALDTVRKSPNIISARTPPEAVVEPGPFRLSYLLADDGVSASLLAYPDSEDGGYFLLLAGLPVRPPDQGAGEVVRREVTLVIDRSGSMGNGKLDQARAAALQVLAGLDAGEAFRIITYNDAVRGFSERAVIKTADTEQAARQHLHQLSAAGGTNIHDALLEALRVEPLEGMLPIVLFLTDGLPTVGQTSEVAIRDVATDHNPFNRRIFTFGVGVDVNTPLLQRIATETRAAATFVLPNEDVEVKVAQVFKKLQGPILTDPELEVVANSTTPSAERVYEVMPARLPDLFEDDQLVVLGRYAGDEPLNFVLRGDYLGGQREFRFSFALDQATTRNAFVPRLWASRRIAALVDSIRQLGADAGTPMALADAASDPRVKELTDEIVRLSTEFGILTEYTAFLAREGTDLSDRDAVLAEANGNFQGRAMAVRTGLGSVNQTMNNSAQMQQQALNPGNRFFDENMNRVAITTVQQINDRAFFQRQGRWVDSRVVNRGDDVEPQKVIEIGTAEFRELAGRLAAEGRPGCVALSGDILLQVDGEIVLVRAPAQQ